MEVVSWPTVASCNECVPIQFGLLSMRVPLARLGRIFVQEGELSGAVHFFGPDNEAKNSVMLGAVPRVRLLGSYETAGLVRKGEFAGPEVFFDQLGTQSAAPGAFAALRRIEKLDRAKRYTKATRGPLHAYAMQAEPPNAEQVYIVIDGEQTVYRMIGRITPEFYEAILSNMQVVPVP